MTIAQIVYDNERQFYSDEEIHDKVRQFFVFPSPRTLHFRPINTLLCEYMSFVRSS